MDITKKILGNILGDGSKNKEMYSVVLRKKINIPDDKIKIVTKNGRKFAVGEYTANGKKYTAWQATK